MNKKVSSIISLISWILALCLLIPYNEWATADPEFNGTKLILVIVGGLVLVNVYRSFIKPGGKLA